MNRKIKIIALGVFLLISKTAIKSQEQTQELSDSKVINIISTYEPSLIDIYQKKNFEISDKPLIDNKIDYTYNYSIPEITITKPELADSLEGKKYSEKDKKKIYDNVLKLGYGNNNSPYGLISLNYGNQKSFNINIFGNYIFSQGNLENQQFRNLRLGALSNFEVIKNHAVKVLFKYNDKVRFLYGYDNALTSYSNNDVRRNISTFSGSVNLFNTKKIWGFVSYDPSIQLDYLSISPPNKNFQSTQEFIYRLLTPVSFDFGKVFSLSFSNDLFFGNFTSVNASSRQYFINHLKASPIFQISNSKSFSFGIIAGLGLFTDNNENKPLYSAEMFTKFFDKKIRLSLMVNSTYQRNSMLNFINENPFFDLNYDLKQTFINEYLFSLSYDNNDKQVLQFSGGVKSFENLPLFNQSENDSRLYLLTYSEPLSSIYSEASYSYLKNNRIYSTLGIKGYIFLNTEDNNVLKNFWGFPPLEVFHVLKWKIGEKFWVKNSFKILSGIKTGFSNGKLRKQAATIFDWGINLEYKLSSWISIWANCNNILNQKYERWIDYPSIGITARAGIILHLDTKILKR